MQQWLAGLEARCLFDLRWRGNGTGTVVAVGGGWVAALWRWRSWDFFVFVTQLPALEFKGGPGNLESEEKKNDTFTQQQNVQNPRRLLARTSSLPCSL